MFDDDGNTALVLKSSGTGGTGAFRPCSSNSIWGPSLASIGSSFFRATPIRPFRLPIFQSQDDFLKGYEIFVNDGQPESRRRGQSNLGNCRL